MKCISLCSEAIYYEGITALNASLLSTQSTVTPLREVSIGADSAARVASPHGDARRCLGGPELRRTENERRCCPYAYIIDVGFWEHRSDLRKNDPLLSLIFTFFVCV